MVLTSEDLQAISGLLEPMREDIRILKEDVAELKEDVTVLKEESSDLKHNMMKLEHQMKNFELDMENVLVPNIQMVAEGHLDLNRKLNEAIKAENERGLLQVRMNLLEKDMRRLKDKAG